MTGCDLCGVTAEDECSDECPSRQRGWLASCEAVSGFTGVQCERELGHPPPHLGRTSRLTHAWGWPDGHQATIEKAEPCTP